MTDLASAQREIARDLQVSASFEVRREIERRVAFLAGRLESTGLRSLVLGVSGGVDSTATGRLCQLAVERVRAAGRQAVFFAVRLPYGAQADEKDARLAVDFIRPDRVLTVDVKPASDALLAAVLAGGAVFADERAEDFALGNIKARQRMVAQYAIAGGQDGLVVGTDHAAEAVSGFFTKYGDGAADVVPLTGLTKRRVRAVARELGAPAQLVHKVPTADLESLNPGQPDEESLGVTYDQLDDFLEGRPVGDATAERIVRRYRLTDHKRRLPTAP